MASLCTGANVLSGHISHCAAPAAENVSAAHAVHCSAVTAPGVEDLNPASHFEHVVASTSELYVPALHIWHVAFPEPRCLVRYPLKQWQSDCRVLPRFEVELPWHTAHTLLELAATAEENVLFPHSVHACAPTAVLYVPCTHARHSCPFAPVYPTLHWHVAVVELPAGPCEFAGQLVQVDVTCATAAEYWSAGQSVHVPMPTAVLNFPAGHAVHSTPSAPPE
jgi:hypothetical protein